LVFGVAIENRSTVPDELEKGLSVLALATAVRAAQP
jgi:hypothetical protein